MIKAFLWLLISLCACDIHAQSHVKDSLKRMLQQDTEDTSRVLHLAALSYEYLESNPDTLRMLALDALTLARRIGFMKGEAVSLQRVGNAYRVYGDYPKALETYFQVQKLNEKIGNLDGIHRNQTSIGVIYNLQDDNRQALTYFFKARKLANEVGDGKALAVILGNIGDTYLNLKIYDSARIYDLQANDLAVKINYPRVIGWSLTSVGNIYFETANYPIALEYYRLSIPYSRLAENDYRLCETFLGMARVFEKSKQQDSALFYSKQSLELASQKNFIKEIRDASRFLSLYYRNIHVPDSAFFYQDITKAANDSLFSQQKNNQIQLLSFNEKIRQSELAAAELKSIKKRNHNLQYAAIVLGLLSFLILFLILSHSIIANANLIRFLGVVALLIVFEFINLLVHPYLSRVTDDSPLIMLLVMVCIAALLVPLHHRMEKWISHKLVEKNKKIRLEAAKRTISKLEDNQTTV
jgi:hypothetical protein